MSFAKTVLNLVFGKRICVLSKSLIFQWGLTFMLYWDLRIGNPPSNPKSNPPQPEKSESRFKLLLSQLTFNE